MSITKKLLIIGVISSLKACCVVPAEGSVLQEGETLQYKVKYGFLRLGTMVVRTFREPASSDAAAYHVSITVESSKGLPFVHIKEYSECLLNASNMFSRCLWAKNESGDPITITRANFDEHARTIAFDQVNASTGGVIQKHTLRDAQPYLDGPSMILFTRTHARCGTVLRVPTFVDGTMAVTVLDFRHAPETVEIDAFPSAIRVRRYDGRAEWSSATEGMSGSFIGLISDDDAAVPIRTEMKIAVGSITIELEKWTRPDWQPPTREIASK